MTGNSNVNFVEMQREFGNGKRGGPGGKGEIKLRFSMCMYQVPKMNIIIIY